MMAQTISSNNSFMTEFATSAILVEASCELSCDKGPHHKSSASISKDDIQAKDVLCGRDKMSHSHVGNKRFLCIIKQNRDAYQNAPSREAKTRLSTKIVAMIRSCGGRFLKCNDTMGGWEPQDDTVAREKVAHALRSCKDPNRTKVKRTRVVKKHVPTQQENMLFEQALQYQRIVFKDLMAQANDSENSESGSESFSSPSSLASEEDYQLSAPIEHFEIGCEIDFECPNFIEDLNGRELAV